MDYEKDMSIDDSALDCEWIDQPTLMVRYCINSAESQRTMDLAKEKLEFTKAELDKEIRQNPEKFGVEKITDKVVENTILLQDAFKVASREYIDAKFEFNTAKGAVEACSQRKDALEQLVKLHGQSYFAGPKVPRNLASERQKFHAKPTLTREK